MKKRTKLAPAITAREETLGWGYFVFELIFLPSLLRSWTAPLQLSDGVVNFLYYALNFLFCLSIFRKYLTAALSYAAKHLPQFLRAVALGFCLYYLANAGLEQLVERIRPGFFNVNDHAISLMFLQNPILMTVGTVLLVPMAEECMFRGLIFSRLYPKNKLGAYLLSAGAFCAIHVAGYVGSYSGPVLALCALQYLLPGLILGWTYIHSGTAAAPIFLHTAINLLAVLSVI